MDHYVIRVPQSVKPALLKALLKEKGFFRVIVFARTRSRADASMRRLRREGYKVETIHSNRSQNQRKRSLDKFASGEVNIITATDVLARGIDVDQVDYVINYDVPDQPEDYIHRIGRTGRAGAKGLAITFVTPETESALRDIEKLIKKKIPEMKLDNFDMEEAAAESAASSINAQSRRDPEVNRVKRDLLNRQRKAQEERQAGAGSRKKSNKNGSSSQGRSQTARNQASKQQRKRGASAKGAKVAAAAKPSKKANRSTASKSGAQSKKMGQSRSPKPSKKGDFRPGRSHRAELQRSIARNKRR